ncbi:peptidyl-prolyl cis-trans isomerase cyclophilin-type family protein [Tripterygium wilfordii]|uniref:Peptidyl-prolyl cis-trans isomerase n=1 Tax=Tripterygium wilfordii TaxID=458696 RepID=A0A7J7CT49_TRIWF|nr:peptidyl-prolyl cis-trans isomerase CYP21-4-like [Tripterygium wilfordii]KAF5737056.1 peptidyl-prolyl cis-trans isomerase cyclophilin-type family protein [Tripterygium wilfordii]
MARIKPQALLIQSKKKKGPSRISATTIVLCTSIVALIILLFTTYRHWSRRSRDQIGTTQSVFEDTNAFIDSKKYDIPGFVILDTSKGQVVVELFKDGSPQIVDKFIDLCQKGYFKGMPFNHVIKNFVIHGGNSEGLGAAEEWTSKGKLHDQLATSPKHEAFMLGTSKTSDRKLFELYITTAPIPDLNDKLLVFGRVIKGEDVVQEIEEVDTDEHYQPKSPMGIIDVTLKREL